MDPTSHAFSRQLACMAGHAYPHASPSLQQQPDPLGMMDNPKMGPMMRALTEDDSLSMSQPQMSSHPGVGFPQNSYPGHQYHSSFSPGRNAQNLQFYSQGPLNASGPDYSANPLQSPGYGIGGGFGHYQRQIPTPSPVMGGGIGSPNGQHGASYPRSASAGPTIPSPIMMPGASMYSNSHTTASAGNMYMHSIPSSSPQLSHSSPLPSRNMRSPAALHSPKSTTSPVSFSCSSPSSVNAVSYGQSVPSQPVCDRTQNTYSASKSPSMGRTFQFSPYNQGINPQQAQLLPNPQSRPLDQTDGSIKSTSYMELINSNSPPPPQVSKQQKMDSQSTNPSVVTNSKKAKPNKKDNPRNDAGSLPKLEEMVAFLGEPSMDAVNHCKPPVTESSHPTKEQRGSNHVKSMQQNEKHNLENNSAMCEDQTLNSNRVQPSLDHSRRLVNTSVVSSEPVNREEAKKEQSYHSSKSSKEIIKSEEKKPTDSVNRTGETEKCLLVNGDKGNVDMPKMEENNSWRSKNDAVKSRKAEEKVSDKISETVVKLHQTDKESCASVPLSCNETVKGSDNIERNSLHQKSDTRSLTDSKSQRETSLGNRCKEQVVLQKDVMSQNGDSERKVGENIKKTKHEGLDEGLIGDPSGKDPPQNGNQHKNGSSVEPHKYGDGRESTVGVVSEVQNRVTESKEQTGHYANSGKVTLSDKGYSRSGMETLDQNQTVNSCMTRKPRKEIDRKSCGDGDSGGCGESVGDSQVGNPSKGKTCDDSKRDARDNCSTASTVEVVSGTSGRGLLSNSDSRVERVQNVTNCDTNSLEGFAKGEDERRVKSEGKETSKVVTCQRIVIPITKDSQNGAVSSVSIQSCDSPSKNQLAGKSAVLQGGKQIVLGSVKVPISELEGCNPRPEGSKQTTVLAGDSSKAPVKLNTASVVITPLRLPESSNTLDLKRKPPDNGTPSGDQSTLPLKKRKGRPPGSKTKVKKDNTSKQTKKRGRQQSAGFGEDEQQELSKFKHLNQAKKVFKPRGSDSPNRGPILSIKGTIENVISSQIVNSSDGGPSKTKRVTRVVSIPSLLTPKGPTSEPSNLTVHPRGKWRCAFCGKPSFFGKLGDLFGPYYPSGIQPEQSNSKDTERDSQSASTSGTVSKNSTPKVPPNRKMPSKHLSSSSRKKVVKTYPGKTKNGPTFLSTGSPSKNASKNIKVLQVFPVKDDSKGHTHAGSSENTASTSPRGWTSDREAEKSEVWVHEDCLVWSQGVFSVGGTLYGLHAAVKEARLVECTHCNEKGATLGCRTKGCKKAFHYLCAIEVGCLLHEHNFSMTCPQHKNKKLKMREDPT